MGAEQRPAGEQNRNPKSSRVQLPWLVGGTRGTRGMLTPLGPLAPCCDTELLPGLPVHGGGSLEELSSAGKPRCLEALLCSSCCFLGAQTQQEPLPCSPPKAGPAPQRPCSRPRPSTGAVPSGCAKPGAEVPSPWASALLRGRGCMAVAGGSCKEPLPVSTDPEAAGQARRASWVSLGSARLAGEGWEFLKASGVALKRFNL